MNTSARVIEVFSSIQGEGIHAGQPHLFIRFWNCNLGCRYCDTDYKGPYREWRREDLLREIARCLQQQGPFHAVSMTGGEPLLWWRFLKDLLPGIKRLGQRVYLETNGTLVKPLQAVLPWTDMIAMDIKPPSATGDRPAWAEHEAFLRAARQASPSPELFVKIVVTAETLDGEVRQAVGLIASVDPEIPLVLQPVTPWGEVRGRPAPEQLARWGALASERLQDVRILPQLHRLLGVP